MTRVMAPVWLLLCIVFGGSAGSGILVNGLLQIAAGSIIVALILQGAWSGLDRPARLLLGIIAAAVVLGLVTLIPLPPALWTLFNGRYQLLGSFGLLHMPAPWLPVSFVPDATIRALLSLLPPLAMFLLVHASFPATRRAAVITLAAATFASVLFGVVQQVAGWNSGLYFYQYSSRGAAIGFFANRNHLGTLCLMTIPFLAAFVAIERNRRERQAEPGRWIPALAALLLLVVGTLVVQSRAGWILLLPTLLVCVLLIQPRRKGQASRTLVAAVAIVVIIAILAALFAPLASFGVSGAGGEVSPQERRTFMELTWQAIRQFWPIGTGWGSFTQVYPRFENPVTVTNTYINHAHNDYLEFLLETGIGGAAIIVAFLVWWAGRIRTVWRSGGDPIARAATVSIGIVMVHSLVDFPARTAAIACVFALCCGLTSAPARTAEPRRRRQERTTGMIMLGAKAGPGRKPRHDPVAP